MHASIHPGQYQGHPSSEDAASRRIVYASRFSLQRLSFGCEPRAPSASASARPIAFGLLSANMNQQQQQQQQVNQPPMEAPAHAIYSSFEELLNASNVHAKAQGYKLVVVRSKTNSQGHKTWVQLACDRHGEQPISGPHASNRLTCITGTKRNTHNLTEETRKKNRRSRRCECPMFCVASRNPSGLWELNVRNAEHNHGPYEPESAVKRKRSMSQPSTQPHRTLTNG